MLDKENDDSGWQLAYERVDDVCIDSRDLRMLETYIQIRLRKLNKTQTDLMLWARLGTAIGLSRGASAYHAVRLLGS